MIKNSLFLLFLSINILASDFINMPLNEYIAIVSRINKINIVLDENIDHKITFLVSKKLSKKTYFEVLKTLLNNRNMYLDKKDNFYMIKKWPKKIQDKNYTNSAAAYYDINGTKNIIDTFYNSIKLNFIDFKDIENFLTVYKNIKYEFVSSSKLLLINSSKSDFKSIKDFISLVDVLPSQLKLKVTIIDTNLDKLKEFGLNHKLEMKSDTNYFFNLIAYPFTISSDIPNTSKNKFYTFLKMINDNGNSKFVSSPILTLSDNKTVEFSVATTIPYVIGSTRIDDDISKTTTSIQYKDVGLKLIVTPRIYNKDLIYMDLDLEVSNIISNVDNIPIVSKKHIKQSFYLNSNNLFVLTGINQNETIENTSGIPLLMDIPFLGWLFKYESKTETSSNLSIFFEIINPKETNLILKHNKGSEIVLIKNDNSTSKKYLIAPDDDLKENENIKLHNERIREIFGI